MENEDDGSAPAVLGIDIGSPEWGLSTALIYCHHRESYLRNFPTIFEVVGSQDS